jgi:hypothetical protein
LFRDITESDATDVQDWLNQESVRTKIAFLLNEPRIAAARFEAKPSSYIDIGDIEVYTKMLKDLGMAPLEGFVEKTGLGIEDITGYGDDKKANQGGGGDNTLPQKRATTRSVASVVVDVAKRLFNRNRPSDGQAVE